MPRRRPARAARLPAAVIRPARAAASRSAAPARASVIASGRSAPASSCVVVGRRRRRRRRFAPIRPSPPRRRRRPAVPGRRRHRRDRAVAAGRSRILAARAGLALAELLHEVVEQVAHRSAESTRPARSGPVRSPSTARTNPARTVSASSFGRIVAARAGSNRNAARIASGDAPRPVRVVGRGDQPEPHLEPPGILEDQARQRAADGRTEPAEGRVGRRPGVGRDVAEADDAVVVGDPQDGQPPAVGRVGRPGHAGEVGPVADADGMLAQERRTGRGRRSGTGAG